MKTQILFLCTENSARSQMAEALVNTLYSDKYQAQSAGTLPSVVDTRTAEAIENFGLSAEGLYSKSINDLKPQGYDYVITLCDKAYGECRYMDFDAERLAWDFPDPKTRVENNAFDLTLKEINERIKVFDLSRAKLADSPTLTPLKLFKCLADETRLTSIFLIMLERKLCVNELTVALNLSQPKISRHLAQLREFGLLSDVRHGQWMFYQINPALPDWAHNILKESFQCSHTDLSEYSERLAHMVDRPERPPLN